MKEAGVVTDGKGNKIANVVDYGFWPEDTMSSYLKNKKGFLQFKNWADSFNVFKAPHPHLVLESGESYTFGMSHFEGGDTTVEITGVVEITHTQS